MHGIAVALLSEDREQLTALQSRLEATRLGRAVFDHVGFPTGPTDSILRQLQESRAEVVVVDVSPRDVQRAVRAIELIKTTTLQIAIFASGDMTQPAGIVASMRAGAGEYIDSSAGSDALLEALVPRALERLEPQAGRGCSPSSAPKEALDARPPQSILPWLCSNLTETSFSLTLLPLDMLPCI